MATTENSPKTLPVATSETPPPPNLWYRLPGDILSSIAKRLAVKSDAAAGSPTSTNHLHALNLLRSVCASWRSSIDKPSYSSFSFLSSLPLALPVPNPNPNSPRTCHFKLSHTTLYFLSPPAGAGWVLRVQEPPARNDDGLKTYHPVYLLSKLEPPEKVPEAFPKSISLLDVAIAEIGRAHCIEVVDYDDEERKARKKELKQAQAERRFVPRSMAEVQADYEESYLTYVKKVAVSPPEHGVVTVVAVQSGRLCSFNLGAGDDRQKWTHLDRPNDRYHDVIYRNGNGKFFAVDYRGRTVVIDGTDLKKQTMKKVAVTRLVENSLPGLGACQLTRLVESGEDLFLIDRYLNTDGGQCMLSIGAITMGMVTEVVGHSEMNNYFTVYRLDEVNKRWEPVDDLGHRVFFLGDDYVFSVDARDFPGLRGNCIYFADMGFLERNEEEAGIGKSCVLTGVYDLKDHSCGPLAMFPDHWPIFAPPPAWLKPKHPVERMKQDELQRDVTGLKNMPEPSPEAKRKAAEAKSRGGDAYRRKDYLVALDAYTQAIDFDPSDATLLSNRSVCWIRLGQAEHALTDAKACRALRPDWAKACYREGAALQLLQRFDEAAFSFNEGVDLDPDSEDLANAFREALEAGRKFRGMNQ